MPVWLFKKGDITMKLHKLFLLAALCLACVLSLGICALAEEKLPEVNIAVSATFEPFEYVDNDNNLAGIDIDIMNELCKKLNVAPKYTNMEFDAIIPSVRSPLADMGISAINPTEQRKKVVDFTDAYITCRVYNPNLDKWYDESYAIALKLTGEYKEELNSAIKELKEDGTIEEIAAKYGVKKDADGVYTYELPKVENNVANDYVVSSWAKPSVEYGIKNNWTAPSDFDNDYTVSINREQFCEITYNMLRDLDMVGTVNIADTSFEDTDNTKVLFLAQEGIISGKGNGIFAPDDTLTRAEAASILCRVARYNGINFSDYTGEAFADDAQIPAWAKEFVYNAVSANIMSGTGNGFSAMAPYTAEQAVSTIERLFKTLK